MARLASSFDTMKDHYQVVVVGSGYGGAIAASRLARAKRQVCLLEQGKEFQPGEYPNTLLEATSEFQISLPEIDVHLGSRTGLYDLHANPDINIFKGCGLGGTSLVNANVSIKPDARVFQEYRWPSAIKTEASTPGSPLWAGYDRAFEMLGANPYPTDPIDLKKLAALQDSAQQMGTPRSFNRTAINVTFEDKVSSGGVSQSACVRCGDCVSGCNYRAKNTTLMNYLPDAVRHGAVIFTKCSVRYLEREGDQWAVWFQRLDSGDEALDSAPRKITAGLVILSGGSLGTTEILLRSKQHDVPLSSRVGLGFSGNGDVLGFGYDLNPEVNGMGWGRVPKGKLPDVGPCITGVIDLRDPAAKLLDGMIIEEGSVPGAVATFMPEVMAGLSRISGQAGPADDRPLKRALDEIESVALGPHHGALQHTQIYLVMAHDGGDGEMRLDDNDRLAISWPGLGKREIFQTINQRLKEATDPLGGTFVQNPLWAVELLNRNLTTVHPLGGCGMADSASEGVVNADCQVFSGDSADAKPYPNLYVMDGAVVPCPVGVNPLLTISALAERAVANLAAANHWTIDETSEPALPAGAPQPGADFTERWRGTLGDASDLALHLSVVARDLNALLNDAQYWADVHGSAALTQGNQTESLAVTGRLATAPGQVIYELELTSPTATLSLTGRRNIPAQPQADLFAAVTSLAIQSAGDPATTGTLTGDADDLLNEAGTPRIYNVDDETERLAKAYSLYWRLLGPLADVYGNVAGRPSVLAPGLPPRKRRTLLAPAPEADYFESSDNRLLRLLHYPGKGQPVLLMHGLGQSSRIFATGAQQPNLVEFLNRFGLDVWLLDDRGSIELPGANQPFNLDQIAAIDLPESIERIARATDGADLALFAHGWGAAAAWMYVLSGKADRVSRFISSQLGPIVDVPAGERWRAQFHTDELWRRLGVRVLGGYDPEPRAAVRLWRSLGPGNGGTAGDIARRIDGLYGNVANGKNLSERVKAALSDFYGPVSVMAGEHVQSIARSGRLVDAAGTDRYLATDKRPDIPILLLHGLENKVSLPSALPKSLRWLLPSQAAAGPIGVLVPDYGQDDSILGHRAARDVFPAVARHLDAMRNA